MALYEEFYNCARPPFNVVPDPRFLYFTAGHREGLAQLLYAVETRKGILVLTGEVGTGKTILLRALLERVGPRVRAGYLLSPPRNVPELFAAISAALGIKLGELNPIEDLNRFLLQCAKLGVTVVLLFDEAQQLSPEVLEQIRLLSNLETESEKLVQLLFAGQPEFDEMLMHDDLRALRQRIVLHCRLAPLSAEETVQYIANRLRVAGAVRSPFALDACAAAHRYSQGVPRLINVLCDNAMITGYALHRPDINRGLIEMAAADLHLERRVARWGMAQLLESAGRVVRDYPRKLLIGAAICLAFVLYDTSLPVSPPVRQGAISATSRHLPKGIAYRVEDTAERVNLQAKKNPDPDDKDADVYSDQLEVDQRNDHPKIDGHHK
jgi:general secretion pathway protein A